MRHVPTPPLNTEFNPVLKYGLKIIMRLSPKFTPIYLILGVLRELSAGAEFSCNDGPIVWSKAREDWLPVVMPGDASSNSSCAVLSSTEKYCASEMQNLPKPAGVPGDSVTGVGKNFLCSAKQSVQCECVLGTNEVKCVTKPR